MSETRPIGFHEDPRADTPLRRARHPMIPDDAVEAALKSVPMRYTVTAYVHPKHVNAYLDDGWVIADETERNAV